MNSNRDPFGFETRSSPAGANPLVVVLQPGQELRIVVPEENGSGAGGFAGFNAGGAGNDSRVSNSGDSRVSNSGDSRVSNSGDASVRSAFGFGVAQRGFTPAPITLVAMPGQEIRVTIARGHSAGGGAGNPGFSLDSRVSGPSKDQGRHR